MLFKHKNKKRMFEVADIMQALSKIRQLRKSIFDAIVKTDSDIVEISQSLPQVNQSIENEEMMAQVSTYITIDMTEPAVTSVKAPTSKHKVIHPSIQVLIDKEKADKQQHKTWLSPYEKARLSAEQYKQEYLHPMLKNASAKCYKKWLKGYLDKGGIATHYYDYEWCGFIATDDIVLKPLFGAQSIDIIVPCDINVEGYTGHCDVFLMKDFSCMGREDFAPVYKDTIVYER